MSDDGVAIHIAELCRTFEGPTGAQHILRGLSLAVEPGSFVTIVGASGSGKSTLLRILGGLDNGYEGTVRIDTTELRGLDDTSMSALRARRIGFVFQSHRLLPYLCARDNVLLASAFHADANDYGPRADALLRELGIEARAAAFPSELSGGEAQRVAVARALLRRPALLLCDEPTGNLDAHSTARVISTLHSARAEGATVIAITHDTTLRDAADVTYEIRDGALHSTEAP